jgi:hypothetical protein
MSLGALLIPCQDPVMAEYITIMIINNKSPGKKSAIFRDLLGSTSDDILPAQITTELEDRKCGSPTNAD